MPYKDPKKQREANRKAQARYYKNNPEYYKKRAKERKFRLREELYEFKKTLSCSRCPEDDVDCLDFHHSDPSTKEIPIARATTQGWSMKRIKEEIAKCEVLCANCHRKHHSLRGN